MDVASSNAFFFKLNDDVAILEYGIAYCAISMFLPPISVVVILAVHRKDRQFPNMSYKIMNIINCNQLAQSYMHFLAGLFLIFPAIPRHYELIVRIVGCTMNTSWIADFPMIALLAICRILIFSNRINARKLPLPAKVLILISWSWIVFVWVYGCITQNMMLLVPGWDYNLAAPYAKLFSDLEVGLTLACLGISYSAYIIVAFLIYKRKTLTMRSRVHTRRDEIGVLLQSTFVTSYITAIIFVWHQSHFATLSFIDMDSQRNQAIVYCCGIAHCYVSPIMILICNQSIRDCSLKMVGLKKKKSREVIHVESPSVIRQTVTLNNN